MVKTESLEVNLERYNGLKRYSSVIVGNLSLDFWESYSKNWAQATISRYIFVVKRLLRRTVIKTKVMHEIRSQNEEARELLPQ